MEVATEPALSFAGLLRQFRAGARLTQEELADAAGLSPRSVSDLERGVNRTARKDTALLLADALSLTGQVRVLFVAAARGRAPAAEVLAAKPDTVSTGTAAAGAGRRGATAWSVLGGLLVIGAGFNGASFLDFGHDFSSLIMALLAIAAIACYAIALFLAVDRAPVPSAPAPSAPAPPG
jgi:transcriptional regulator with XRE-family HTH domain